MTHKRSCPTPDTMTLMLKGQLGAEKMSFLKHINNCEECAAEYALLKAMSFESSIYDDTEQGCPNPEMMRRLLNEELEDQERNLVLAHLMSCNDCSIEYAFLKAMAKEETAEGSIKPVRKYLEELGERIVKLVHGGITIVTWPAPVLTPIAARKGIAASRSASEVMCGRNGDDQTGAVTLKQNESFFEFELFKQTRVLINLPLELDSERKYELCLWSAACGARYSYPAEETRQKGMAVVTDKLNAGKYLAAIAEVRACD